MARRPEGRRRHRRHPRHTGTHAAQPGDGVLPQRRPPRPDGQPPQAVRERRQPQDHPPDGTGPYRLDKTRTTVGTKWSYTRNADYWGTRLPYKSLTFSFFDNETAITNGLKTGQINAALLQTADQQIAIETDPKVTTQKQEFDFQGLLLFDRDGRITPALRDPRVRQALNYAVDRATMLDRIRQNRGRITSQSSAPRPGRTTRSSTRTTRTTRPRPSPF